MVTYTERIIILQNNQVPEIWLIFLEHPIEVLFAAATLTAAAFITARYMYERELSTLRTERDSLRDERNILRADVEKLRDDVDGFRKNLPVPVVSTPDVPPASLRDAKTEYLRTRARQHAETLRELQESYSSYDHKFPSSNASEEERQRVWEQQIQRDNQRRMEIARRYSKIRGEVIALKDELLRRVHPSVATNRDKFIDHTYEMQAGPSPFHEIADDLEKLSLNLN